MIDTLVVVATHNAAGLLERCLDSLGTRYPVLVVDTRSTDPIHNGYIENLPLFTTTPFEGFTTGAYLWAYWNFPAKNYFFMQDSMELLEDGDYLASFKERLGDQLGAVAWATFSEGWDDAEQAAWGHYLYDGDYQEGEGWGIFGPIFYTSAATLDDLRDKQLLPPIPMNKLQAQGTERLWGWALRQAGHEVHSLGGEWDGGAMQRGEFPLFRKTFVGRT